MTIFMSIRLQINNQRIKSVFKFHLLFCAKKLIKLPDISDDVFEEVKKTY